MNKWYWAAFLAVFSFLVGFSVLRAKTLDEIALVVDDETLTQSELDEQVRNFLLAQGAKVPDSPQSPAYQEALKQVIDGFIEEVLLAEQADQQKMEVTDGELDHSVNQQIEGMKKGFPTEQDFLDELSKEGVTQEDLRQEVHATLLRKMKANRALRAKQTEMANTAVVTDEAAQAYYKEHPSDYEEVKFSMILYRIPLKPKPGVMKTLENKAQQSLKELQEGEDFAAYAKKYSEDQGSAEKGGEVGTVYRSEMEPHLAQGVFDIPEKSMGIVKAPDGIYIVKVDYKGKSDYPSVASDIKERLKKEGQDSVLKDWIAGLRKKAYVEYHRQILAFNSSVSSIPQLSLPAAEKEETKETPIQATPTPAPEASRSMGTTFLAGSTSKISETTAPNSLPDEGSLALYFRVNAWTYGTQDLSDYYVSSVNSSQNFPFGFDLAGGFDLALDTSFQLGIMISSISKVAESVVDQAAVTETWNEGVLGGSLAAKLIFPLNESLNVIVGGSGGYYLLLSSSLAYSGAVTASLPLNGASLGGEARADLEIFLDSNKSAALDFGGGYRYLKITPNTTGTSSISNGVSVPSIAYSNSALPNASGTTQILDFSGIELGVSMKFYLGK